MAKTILHNFATLNLGGAESRILDLMRGINRKEFQFDFVVYDEAIQHFEELVGAGEREDRPFHPKASHAQVKILSPEHLD